MFLGNAHKYSYFSSGKKKIFTVKRCTVVNFPIFKHNWVSKLMFLCVLIAYLSWLYYKCTCFFHKVNVCSCWYYSNSQISKHCSTFEVFPFAFFMFPVAELALQLINTYSLKYINKFTNHNE